MRPFGRQIRQFRPPHPTGGTSHGKMIQSSAPDICAALRQAKDAAGETNHSLSEATGIPESTVAKILSGTRSDPTFSNVAALAAALDLSLDRLAGRQPPPDDAAVLRAQLAGAQKMEGVLNSRLAVYERGVRQRNAAICVLLAMTVLLASVFVLYVILDFRNPEYGFFRVQGPVSPLAYLAILSPGIIIPAVIHAVAHRRKDPPVSSLDTDKK